VPLRLLLIENSDDEAMLLVLELRKGGFEPDFARVETPQELEAALNGNSWDSVICDNNIPAFTGLDALRIINAKGLDIPFILVSGVIGEELAVEALKAGAHDIIMKGNFSRLAPALERELHDAEVRRERRKVMEELQRSHEELEIRVRQGTAELVQVNEALRAEIAGHKHMEVELRESWQRLTDIIQFYPDATMVVDIGGNVIAWNRAMEVLTGLKTAKSTKTWACPWHQAVMSALHCRMTGRASRRKIFPKSSIPIFRPRIPTVKEGWGSGCRFATPS
jgi:FixJ family two-component response regulator